MPNDARSNDTETFDFSAEKHRLTSLLADWTTNEQEASKVRRAVRLYEVNVEKKQADKEIAPDETIIPRRIIDQNIARDMPAYVAYLEQSVRLVLFKSVNDPTKDTTPLADWFTTGMRYPGWSNPWHATIDGSILHGGTFIEVRIDPSAPLGVILESVQRDALIFPTKTRKGIQRCEKIMRRYEYLPNELEDAVEDFGFDKAQVATLLSKDSRDKNREIPVEVYKVFFKRKKIVYVAWWAERCDNWIKAPAPLDMGIYAQGPDGQLVPQPCADYPFFWLPQAVIEDELLLNVKGRAYKDLADQDALTTVWTGIVNGTDRASKAWASQRFNPSNPEGQQNLVIAPGVATTQELVYQNVPYPDPMILTVAQALSGQNLQQSGQIDFAANNRQDSRKTAQEIKTATQQSGLLSSVRLVPLATCVREVYSFVWRIVESHVLVGLREVPDAIKPYIGDSYYILAAGDTEVIKKAEKIAALQMFYPVVAQSPIGNQVLTKIIELQFPDEAPRWAEALQKPDLAPIVMQLGQVLASLPRDNMDPQTIQQLDAILANAQSVLQSGSMAGGPPAIPGATPGQNPAIGAGGPQGQMS